jgi:hypothetical protein
MKGAAGEGCLPTKAGATIPFLKGDMGGTSLRVSHTKMRLDLSVLLLPDHCRERMFCPLESCSKKNPDPGRLGDWKVRGEMPS